MRQVWTVHTDDFPDIDVGVHDTYGWITVRTREGHKAVREFNVYLELEDMRVLADKIAGLLAASEARGYVSFKCAGRSEKRRECEHRKQEASSCQS